MSTARAGGVRNVATMLLRAQVERLRGEFTGLLGGGPIPWLYAEPFYISPRAAGTPPADLPHPSEFVRAQPGAGWVRLLGREEYPPLTVSDPLDPVSWTSTRRLPRHTAEGERAESGHLDFVLLAEAAVADDGATAAAETRERLDRFLAVAGRASRNVLDAPRDIRERLFGGEPALHAMAASAGGYAWPEAWFRAVVWLALTAPKMTGFRKFRESPWDGAEDDQHGPLDPGEGEPPTWWYVEFDDLAGASVDACDLLLVLLTNVIERPRQHGEAGLGCPTDDAAGQMVGPFSTKEAQAILGIEESAFRDWKRNEKLPEHILQPRGSGNFYLFDERALRGHEAFNKPAFDAAVEQASKRAQVWTERVAASS